MRQAFADVFGDRKQPQQKCKKSAYQSILCFGCRFATECQLDAIKKAEAKLQVIRERDGKA